MDGKIIVLPANAGHPATNVGHSFVVAQLGSRALKQFSGRDTIAPQEAVQCRGALVAIPAAVNDQDAPPAAGEHERCAETRGTGPNNDCLVRCHHNAARAPPERLVSGSAYAIAAGMRADDINGRDTWFNNWSAFSSSASDA